MKLKLLILVFLVFFGNNIIYSQNTLIPSCSFNSATDVANWSIFPTAVTKQYFNGNCIAMFVDNLPYSQLAYITSPIINIGNTGNYEMEISYGLVYTTTPILFELLTVPSSTVVNTTTNLTTTGTCVSWPNPKICKLNFTTLPVGNYRLRVTIPGPSQFFIESLKSSINYSLNINETVKNSNFSISPNPTNNFITIQKKEKQNENFEYKIVDLTGRIVKNGNSKFNEQINIESLTSGNYIIQIQTENGEKLTEKLVKN